MIRPNDFLSFQYGVEELGSKHCQDEKKIKKLKFLKYLHQPSELKTLHQMRQLLYKD